MKKENNEYSHPFPQIQVTAPHDQSPLALREIIVEEAIADQIADEGDQVVVFTTNAQGMVDIQLHS